MRNHFAPRLSKGYNINMDSENKEDPSKGFGKVIDALHNKSKLPSLRTYQGDVAEFIKEKNESVLSVAVKEKKREEKKEEEEKKERKEEKEEKKPEPVKKPSSVGMNLQINFTMVILSLLLIVGGAVAAFYVYNILGKESVSEVVLEEEIIPYNSSATLTGATKTTLGAELAKLSLSGGINIIKISDSNGSFIKNSKNFFGFMDISLPPTLERTLEDEYAIGAFSQNNTTSYFIVIKVNDFGRSFSAMLEWEETMEKDLSFLNISPGENSQTALAQESSPLTASSTASTTTKVITPAKPELFNWKDIIIKNKDTRGLVNGKGKSKIAYTFLDKNTILIINNISAIGDISSAYNSRSVAR